MGWGVLTGGDVSWSGAAADVCLSLGLSDSEALLFRFLGRDREDEASEASSVVGACLSFHFPLLARPQNRYFSG